MAKETKNESNDPLQPSIALLCKLGSIVVHVDEMMGITGHQFDPEAIKSLLADAELQSWIKKMNAMAMLPKKRSIEDVRLAARKQTKRWSK